MRVRGSEKSEKPSARRRAYVGNTSYVVYVRYVVANYTGASRELHLYMIRRSLCVTLCAPAMRIGRGAGPYPRRRDARDA